MATCETCKANKVCDHNKYGFENCNNYISADVVEIVRCKDCKHLKIINDGKIYAKCLQTDFEFMPFGTDTRTHYCSYGERKDT